MIDQIIAGVGRGLLGLLILYAGYCMFYVGKKLVNKSGSESSPPRRMSKWKALLVAAIVTAVLGLIAAVPNAGGGSFYLLDEPEPYEYEDAVATDTKSPTKRFFMVFVFCCGAMWAGVARSDDR